VQTRDFIPTTFPRTPSRLSRMAPWSETRHNSRLSKSGPYSVSRDGFRGTDDKERKSLFGRESKKEGMLEAAK
jgi:hypothetical protein